MTENYFRNAQAVILVFKMSAVETLNATKDWLGLVKEYATGDVLVSLWGHERDDEVVLSEDEANRVTGEIMKGFAAAHDIPEDLLFVVNAKTGENVNDSFSKLVERLHCRLKARGLSPSPEHTKSFRLGRTVSNENGAGRVNTDNVHEMDRGDPPSNGEPRGCALKRC